MEIENKPILSVTEISLSLKSCVEQVFSDIRVKGEVVGVKKAPSGHIYFSLKDNDSVLSAVCWRGRDKTTLASLEDGLEIVCTGKLSTYPGRSNYQMIVDKAEPAGIGALLKLLAERKEKLEKEGLFDASKKKKIPYLPETIGVVTSPSGAVIRDIMHRLNERFPREVYLWPVLVQGEGAAEQIAAAINGFNNIPKEGLTLKNKHIKKPDVLIVARGGGSFEDLWCFNEEIVVRATAASKIPIISAVGHETDTTLIDFASDLRAPTPTGAAEKAVPVRSELISTLTQLSSRNIDALYRFLNESKLKLESLSRSMPKLNELINLFFEKLDDKTERFKNALKTFFTTTENKLFFVSKLLSSYSYNEILKRGFSLVTDTDGKVITSGTIAETKENFFIKFSDKNVLVSPTNKSTTSTSVKKKKTTTESHQINLFKDI